MARGGFAPYERAHHVHTLSPYTREEEGARGRPMKSLTTRAYLTAHDRESIFVRVERREDWGRGEEGISKVRETRVVVKFTATRTCSFLFYGEEDHYLIWKSIVGIIVHFLFGTVFF